MPKKCSNCANYVPLSEGSIRIREDSEQHLLAILGIKLACEKCRKTSNFGCINSNPYWPLLGKLCTSYVENDTTSC